MRKTLLALVGVDMALVVAAWWLSFWLRFNFEVPEQFAELSLLSTPICFLAFAASLWLTRAYRHVWSFAGLLELRQLATGVLLGAALTAAGVLMLRLPDFPRSVLVLHPVLALLLLGGARAVWRTLSEQRRRQHGATTPVVVVGALQDAAAAVRTLKESRRWRPVAIASPIAAESGRSLQDVSVKGSISDLRAICHLTGATTAIIASPPGSEERRTALLAAADARVSLLTMPRADDWLRSESSEPRKVELEDLLGRAPVALDVAGLSELFSGQVVLVTGAGGSIGSELCRQIARFGVVRLVCVDSSEYAIYQLEQELRQAHPQMQGSYYTANVREYDRLRALCEKHKPTVVFHAAAYKHVPLMEEDNEIEALRTNVAGTLNAARAAGACGARRFVMISTDKAVNPTNVMGASKRLAELLVQAVAAVEPGTQFVSVRFGNVLGSSGSVVPLFTKQIAAGGPLTVTHPDIVRYFMTIPEAAQLVLQAGLMGKSGQIFVLDMGEPVKIVELARMLIRLSGKTEQDIPITYSGLRPGEKLFEELMADDETTEPTPHPKLRIAKSSGLPPAVEGVMTWITEAGPAPAGQSVRDWLRTYVPEYSPRAN